MTSPSTLRHYQNKKKLKFKLSKRNEIIKIKTEIGKKIYIY